VILVDTAIWVDHFRRAEPQLVALLASGRVVIHPFVIGELIMGNIPSVERIISDMTHLPQIDTVSDTDFYKFVTAHKIGGTGLGFVDTHLIAAVFGSAKTSIWTRDKRLMAQAERLNCSCHSE
jgi:predicted nucleic acid-binding protein